jgi:hypothetical protein
MSQQHDTRLIKVATGMLHYDAVYPARRHAVYSASPCMQDADDCHECARCVLATISLHRLYACCAACILSNRHRERQLPLQVHVVTRVSVEIDAAAAPAGARYDTYQRGIRGIRRGFADLHIARRTPDVSTASPFGPPRLSSPHCAR